MFIHNISFLQGMPIETVLTCCCTYVLLHIDSIVHARHVQRTIWLNPQRVDALHPRLGVVQVSDHGSNWGVGGHTRQHALEVACGVRCVNM